MIGLTGGIASGKSTAANRLRELGAFVADADIVSREVIEFPEVLDKIRSEFGGGVFRADGSLDRRALAALAFSTAQGTAALNAAMHPAILKRLLEAAKNAEAEGYPLVFADAALLIETGFHNYCDGVWLITADENARILRIMQRDGLTRDEAALRIARQMPDREKERYATVVIDNDGSPEELMNKVDYEYYKALSRVSAPDPAYELEEIKGVYEK